MLQWCSCVNGAYQPVSKPENNWALPPGWRWKRAGSATRSDVSKWFAVRDQAHAQQIFLENGKDCKPWQNVLITDVTEAIVKLVIARNAQDNDLDDLKSRPPGSAQFEDEL